MASDRAILTVISVSSGHTGLIYSMPSNQLIPTSCKPNEVFKIARTTFPVLLGHLRERHDLLHAGRRPPATGELPGSPRDNFTSPSSALL